MKTKTLAFLLLAGMLVSMGFGLINNSESTLLLKDAVKQNLITCKMENNKGFSHYNKCLLLHLKNNGNNRLQIKIPVGMQVCPNDSIYQNLVLTENMFVELLPNENKKIAAYAMCTEPSDHAPGEAPVYYTLGKDAKPALLELSNLIAQEKLFNAEAQNAVWCVAAGYPITDINGFDTTAVRKLQTMVAKLTHQKMPPPPKRNDYRRNYYAPASTMKVSVGGNYSFNFSRTKQILIGMFNIHNVLVRELYKNPAEAPGRKTINYAFDASVYTDSLYYMRLFVDGEKRMESRMALK